MIASFSILPICGGCSLSGEVAKALEVVERSGLPYKLTAMGTELEGSWEQVMNVIKQCHDRLAKDNERLYMTIAIDDRRGGQGEIAGKVQSVEKKVGHALKK